MSLAPLDELRALPAPLARAVLARIARERGPAAVAALRWQIDAHRRPTQCMIGLDDLCDDGRPWRVLIIEGEYGSGKTQLATWIAKMAITEWKVERPRLVAAIPANVDDTLVNGPSGILSWLPPWVSREWQPSTGHAGKLWIDGREVSCLSAAAGAGPIGSGCGFVLFDDYAKCVSAHGAAAAEEALAAAFKSLRESPGKMLLPTTPDGAEMVRALAGAEGMRGVLTMSLGRTEDNRALTPAAFDFAQGLRRMNMWTTESGGAFSHIEWSKLRAKPHEVPKLKRIIVFVDPAKSQRSRACKVGIVATGIDHRASIYWLANRSGQRPPDGPEGWPRATLDLAEEIERRYGVDVELGIEINTLGKAGPAMLRGEERMRRAARGEEAASTRKIHEVTSRPTDSKTHRAAPIVAMAEGGQVRSVDGCGEVESSLSGLTDGGTKSDEGDAAVHGARILVGKDADQPDRAPAARAAVAALDRLQEKIGAPPNGPRAWDRV